MPDSTSTIHIYLIGPRRENSIKVFTAYRHIFPNSSITWITWFGEDTANLLFDEIIQLNDPGEYKYFKGKSKNILRQIVLSASIPQVGSKTVIRGRSDILPLPHILNEVKLFKEKTLYIDSFIESYEPFFICDFFLAGPRGYISEFYKRALAGLKYSENEKIVEFFKKKKYLYTVKRYPEVIPAEVILYFWGTFKGEPNSVDKLEHHFSNYRQCKELFVPINIACFVYPKRIDKTSSIRQKLLYWRFSLSEDSITRKVLNLAYRFIQKSES